MEHVMISVQNKDDTRQAWISLIDDQCFTQDRS